MFKSINKKIKANRCKIGRKGFTFIELLVVIGIIVILTGIIVVAVNPGERLLDARDNQRKAHTEAIYGAIEHYSFQEGSIPTCVGETESDAINCEEELTSVYMVEIPKDPVCGNGDTGYLVRKNAQNEVGVKADCAEGEEEITVGTW